jgi:hypothetical protein
MSKRSGGRLLPILFWGCLWAALAGTAPATDVTGNITSNTTWNVAGSPYRLTGNVIVNTGVTLTIDPGVLVQGNDLRELRVNGNLQAIGTMAQPITFTSFLDSSTAQWAGILFQGATAAGTLEHCEVRFSGDNGSLTASIPRGNVRAVEGATVTIRDSLIRLGGAPGNDSGVFVRDSSITLESVEFRDNGLTSSSPNEAALWVEKTAAGTASVSATGCLFQDNGQYAIRAPAESVHLITGNTFSGNDTNRVFLDFGPFNAAGRLAAQTGLEAYEFADTDSRYTVPAGGTLTIDAGVTILAREFAELFVQGTLQAIGTAGQQIVFSSAQDTAVNQWAGIVATDATATLNMTQCLVRFGGDVDSLSGTVVANVKVLDGANATISNCVIRSGGALLGTLTDAGLYARDAGSVTVQNTTFDDNTEGSNSAALWATGTFGSLSVTGCNFMNNGSFAMRLPANQAHNATGNTFSGNVFDRIVISGGQFASAPTLTVQTGLEGYEIEADATVPTGATLTVNPGVTVYGRGNVEITVQGNLVAMGTPSNRVIFTSSSDTGPGEWTGLIFNGLLGDASGTLDNVELRYGGDLDALNSVPQAVVRVITGASLTMTNSTIRASQSGTADAGLFAEDCSLTLDAVTFRENASGGRSAALHIGTQMDSLSVSNCVFQNNVRYAAIVPPDEASSLQANNTFSGNGLDRVIIRGSVFTESETLRAMTGLAGYEFENDLAVPSPLVLTVEPGLRVFGLGNAELIIAGSLMAQGTAPLPIEFTSSLDTGPSEWAGISFDGSAGLGVGVFEFCEIHRGGDPTTLDGVFTGNLSLANSADVTLTDCVIGDGGDLGMYILDGDFTALRTTFDANGNTADDAALYATGSSRITVTDCVFQDNSGYAVRSPANQIHKITGCQFVDNGLNRVLVEGGTVDPACVLDAQTGLDGFELLADTTVPSGGVLTIEEGLAIRGSNTDDLIVLGDLQAIGTTAQPVVFASAADDGLAQWAGIAFDGLQGATGTLQNCQVRRGGSAGSFLNTLFRANIYVANGANVTISDCLFTDGPASSSMEGHINVVDSSLTVSNTTFTTTGTTGVDFVINLQGTSTIALDGSSFEMNGGYPIRVPANQVQNIANNNFLNNGFDRILVQAGTLAMASRFAKQTGTFEGFELEGDILAPTGSVLTVEAGALVRARNNVELLVQGRMEAMGTEVDPILFTSDADSAPSEWTGIIFDGGGAAEGTGIMEHCVVRNGGDNNSLDSSVHAVLAIFDVETGQVVLNNCEFANGPVAGMSSSNRYGVYIDRSVVMMDGCLVRDHAGNVNNNDFGVFVTGSTALVTINNSVVRNASGQAGVGIASGQLDAFCSDFIMNGRDGFLRSGGTVTLRNVDFTGNGRFGLNNTGAGMITAEDCWWGSDTGPTAASNPGGTGASVNGSVDFDPWLMMDSCEEPMAGATGVLIH